MKVPQADFTCISQCTLRIATYSVVLPYFVLKRAICVCMYVSTTGLISIFPHSPLDRSSWSHFLKHSWEPSGLVLLPLHSSDGDYQKVGLDLCPCLWVARKNTWLLSFTLFPFTHYGFGLGQCIKLNKPGFNSSLKSTDVAGEEFRCPLDGI